MIHDFTRDYIYNSHMIFISSELARWPFGNHFTLCVYNQYCILIFFFFFILLQWKNASSTVNNRRGKKNLVLSSWGDESVLTEDYVNPHYTTDCYQSYSERTNQNLVSFMPQTKSFALFFKI